MSVRQSGLFGTPAAMRLIGLLYLNAERSYRLSEIIDALRGTVERRAAIYTLTRLVEDGFVEKTGRADSPVYRANPRCYLFDELKSIALKTFGGFEEIVAVIAEDSNVVAAGIYGSFAKGRPRADSDIDLLLIVADPADLALLDLLGRIESIAARVGRSVNATTYTDRERRAGSNAFLRKVLDGPVIWLKGGDDDAGANPG